MSDSDWRHQIYWFIAEFSDPGMEARFRASVVRQTVKTTCRALLFGGAFFVLFSYSDYAALGYGPAFMLALGARILAFAAVLLAIFYLYKHPMAAMAGTAVTLVEIFGVLVFVLIMILRPLEIGLHTNSALVLMIAYWLFIPNRFIMALAASMIAAVGFMLSALLILRHNDAQLVNSCLLVILANFFGAIGCWRQSLLQRQAFSLLNLELIEKGKLKHEIAQRQQLQAELELAATTDPLTNLLNRGHFLKCSNLEIRKAHRRGTPVSVLFLDVDGFKAINDKWGHESGDRALRQVAQLCTEIKRESDLLGRLGGEEFAMLLPDAELAGAAEVSERLRHHLAATPLHLCNGKAISITVTIGVAPCESNDILDALKLADAAMYRGKHKGGNTVITATPGTAELSAGIDLIEETPESGAIPQVMSRKARTGRLG